MSDEALDKLQRSRHRLQIWWAIFGIALGLLAGVVLSQAVFSSPGKWNPLGTYAVQHVENPSVVYGGTVNVSGVVWAAGKPTTVGVKCAKERVTVATAKSWASPGVVVPAPGTVSVRAKGCEVRPTFNNEVPEAVLAHVRSRCQARLPLAIWTLSGRETPVKPDGQHGVQHVWKTEPFVIHCPVGLR